MARQLGWNWCTYISCIAAVCVSIGHAYAETMSLRASGGRPVRDVTQQLSTRLGYIITYEDPRYECQDDLVPAKAIKPGDEPPKLFWPKGGTLELQGLVVPKDKDRAWTMNVLSEVLALQTRSASGGRFTLLQSPAALHVVPESVRNRHGQWVPQTSLLEVNLIIPPAQRTVERMIDAICQELTRTTGFNVVAGDPLVGAQGPETVQRADNEPARDVLMRTLALRPRGM